MSYLKNAGIVGSRKKDQWIFYFILDEVQGFLGQIWKFIEKDHLLSKDIEVFDVMYSNRELTAFHQKNPENQFLS